MGHDLADHEPVEQTANCGKAKLRGRGGARAAQGLDVGGDVQRLYGRDRDDSVPLTPGEEFTYSAGVGAARVSVADRGGEEFEEAQRCAIAGGRDDRRQGFNSG